MIENLGPQFLKFPRGTYERRVSWLYTHAIAPAANRHMIAVSVAECVLWTFERESDDRRPRKAIEEMRARSSPDGLPEETFWACFADVDLTHVSEPAQAAWCAVFSATEPRREGPLALSCTCHCAAEATSWPYVFLHLVAYLVRTTSEAPDSSS